MQKKFKLNPAKALVHGAVVSVLCTLGTGAQAQISRGFIAPHEYALPVDFKPFNIFVEYATLQKSDRVWDSGGDKNSANDTEVLVALTKYVHLWTPESNSKVGLAWEIIVPKVGIRDKTAGNSNGGIADPITGFAVWYKPADNWTLGLDLFAQIPVGDKDVGGGDRWNISGSFFWDGQFDKVNYTGDVGYNLPGAPTNGARPGKLWHMNHRLGYRVSDLVEPYIGLDYEHQQSKSGNARNYETAAAVGLMFHTYKHSHIAVHYEKGLDGESRAVSDNVNVRFAYVW